MTTTQPRTAPPQPTPLPNSDEALTPAPSPWLTTAEVANLVHLSEQEVRRHASAGLIPHDRKGRSFRFRRAVVEAWLAGQDERAVAPSVGFGLEDLVRALSQLDIVATGPGRFSVVRRGPRAVERWVS